MRALLPIALLLCAGISSRSAAHDLQYAVAAGAIERHGVAELGAVISGAATGRSDDSQVTVCDLTGVAVQDIQIARAVMDGAAPR